MFERLFRDETSQEAGRTAYLRIVEQSRRPEFYLRAGVPDSLDGRFDLIVLHVFLVLHRLKGAGAGSADFGQSLFDTLFLDMDQSLRELGVGDLGVGKRVKQMVQAFYGRTSAYEQALGGDPDRLEAALRRNLYGTVSPEPAQVTAMADYVRRQVAALAAQEESRILAGAVTFTEPATPAGAA